MIEFDDDGVVDNPAVRVVKLRTAFNYDRLAASAETWLHCKDETMTQQQFKTECDINHIVEMFGVTGTLPSNGKIPLNADFVDVMDYRSALDRLMEAEASFMSYPAELRARFQNNPGLFVDFVSNPENQDEVSKWGLAKPRATVSSTGAPVLSQPASDGVNSASNRPSDQSST